MKKKIDIAVIHGINRWQQAGDLSGFEDPIRRGLDSLAAHVGDTSDATRVHGVAWGHLASEYHGKLPAVADYLADVVVYAQPGASRVIRAEVWSRLCEIRPRVVVAHSLGGVILCDAMTDALAKGSSLPFDAIVTLGTPLGITVPIPWAGRWIGYRDRASRLAALARPVPRLPWVNIFDDDDPVPTGSPWGDRQHPGIGQIPGYDRFDVTDLAVDAGVSLAGHLLDGGYGDHPITAQAIRQLALGDLT